MAVSVLLGWSLVVPTVFRLLGRRNGTLIAVIGGLLWLPPGFTTLPIGPVLLRFDKQGAIGLALLIAMLVWDRRALLSFRPRPLDAPVTTAARPSRRNIPSVSRGSVTLGRPRSGRSLSGSSEPLRLTGRGTGAPYRTGSQNSSERIRLTARTPASFDTYARVAGYPQERQKP